MVNSVLLLADLLGATAIGKPGSLVSFYGKMENGWKEREFRILGKRGKFVISIFENCRLAGMGDEAAFKMFKKPQGKAMLLIFGFSNIMVRFWTFLCVW